MKLRLPQGKIGSCLLSVLLATLVCIFSIAATGQWLRYGCLWWACSYRGPFNSESIQIPPEYFPSGSTYIPLYPDRDLAGALQREFQEIWWDNDNGPTFAKFTVYHYASARSAARRYEVELRILSDIPARPWNPPQALSYQGKVADEYFIGCGGV
jgi:hypothetical protein